MTTQITPIQELTFIIRVAPDRSRYAGILCAELRTTTAGQAIKPVLRELGLITEENPIIAEGEVWKHPYKGWRLFRFPVENMAEVCLMLHEKCSPSNEEAYALMTEEYMAKLSQPTAVEALLEHPKKTLIAMAQLLPNYESLGSKANKQKLAEFIVSMSDATIGKPIAA